MFGKVDDEKMIVLGVWDVGRNRSENGAAEPLLQPIIFYVPDPWGSSDLICAEETDPSLFQIEEYIGARRQSVFIKDELLDA